MLTLKMTIQTEFDSKIQATNNRFVDSELGNRNYKDGLIFLGLEQFYLYPAFWRPEL